MDMNRIITVSLFEPVKEFDVVATIVCKVTGIMVNRNKFNCLFAFFYSFNKGFSAVYCFTPRPFMKTISRWDSDPQNSASKADTYTSYITGRYFVLTEAPGLGPRRTDLETAMLPLHHTPI